MILQFKDINANPISINIKYIVSIYCDSEILLITGETIKLDIPYEDLLKIVYVNLK